MKAANQNDNECKQCRVLLEASQGRSPFTIFGSPFSLHSSNIVILTVHLKDSGIKVFLQEIFRKRANNPENTVRAVATPEGGLNTPHRGDASMNAHACTAGHVRG